MSKRKNLTPIDKYIAEIEDTLRHACSICQQLNFKKYMKKIKKRHND